MSVSSASNIQRLAMKLLWRDWRGGELNVLVAALLVAVMTVTGIGLFSDRISNSIVDEAGSLLAADAQITGSRAIPQAWKDEAIGYQLKTAELTEFSAMAFGEQNTMQLASVKAASSSYPLKGELKVSDQPFTDGVAIASGPPPGEAWINSRLMASLNLSVGDVIGVGDADLVVGQVLISEPDEAGGNFGLNPRILINNDDVGLTGAVQVGSRVRYSLLMEGDVAPFYQQWKTIESEHHRWRNVEDAEESVTSTLDRAESFLLLAGSLGVILAGVALALASKRYALRQLGHVALLKTLGLTPFNIARLYAGNLLFLGLVVVVLGIALGWFLHWAFLELFAGLLPRNLVEPTFRPYLIGFLTGLLCLMAFAFPPVWVLRNTPPSRVLRSDVAGGTISQWRTTLLGTLAVVGLVFFYSGSPVITAALVLAGGFAVIGVTLLARVMIWAARRFGARFGTTWRLGLANLQRHGRQNGFQIMIFSMSLMLLFLLALLRTSLLSEWQNQLPEGTPNHFAFNIFENERSGIESMLAENDVPVTPFYPMIRGRLTVINDETMQDRLDRLNPDGDDFRRELNITWSSTLAEDNEVVEGEWFTPGDENQSLVSIEKDFADELDVKVGDRMTFSFGGQLVEATVDNIRTVQWDSLAPNFYIIFSGPILEGAGAAYLTSFFLTPEQKPLLVEILSQYPTVSVVEVDVILERIQSIVAQVTLAIEFILGLVLVSGFIVLVASVQATLDSRLQESAILRTIGARARVVQGALAIEFIMLGALAGLLAAVGAEVGLYFLQTELLNMEFSPHLYLLLVGPLVGAALIGSVGMVSTRKVVKVPPLTVLRRL